MVFRRTGRRPRRICLALSSAGNHAGGGDEESAGVQPLSRNSRPLQRRPDQLPVHLLRRTDSQKHRLAREVPVWRKGQSRKTVETSKFYLFDTGVTRRLQRRKELVRGTPEYGDAFESWILHEISAYADACRRDAEIAYWRTRTKIEVDFVINGETAIEVKTTRNADKEDLKGLRAIADEGRFARRLLVCDEPTERETDGIVILPWRVFIDQLWSGRIF